MKDLIVYLFLLSLSQYGHAQQAAEFTGSLTQNATTQPRWPGATDEVESQRKLLIYTYQHLRYPLLAKHNHIEGVVHTKFIIDSLGGIQQPNIIQDIGWGCGDAALEVLHQMQNEITWQPALLGDQAVHVEYTLPIYFILDYNDIDPSQEIRYAIIVIDRDGNRYMNEANQPFSLTTSYVAEKIDSFRTLQNHNYHTKKIYYKDIKEFYVRERLTREQADNLEDYLIGCEVIHNIVDDRPLFMIPEALVYIEDRSKLFKQSAENLKIYIRENLRYPRRLKKAGISGMVLVDFAVDRDGLLSAIQIAQSVHPELDEIALQFVQTMEPYAWHPGLIKGIPVRTRFRLPLKFEE